jgi:hypothetical protein
MARYHRPARVSSALAAAVCLALCPAPVASAEGDAAAEPPPPARARVSFDRDVRPILSNHCFKCHGPDVHEADLRLDLPAAVGIELPSGAKAIVPGDPEASELVQRIASTDPDARMPPPDEAPPLAPHQIDVLSRWIAEGAAYERHWAYRPPARPEPPAVRNEAWPRAAIDRFVLARLEAAGLEPAPEATRATLIRRLSLDLIGLPPTPEEVAEFVADPAADAYERLVDRLLDSPQYGVRQALVWLDLARYADSDGYPHDRYRAVWPYRDWVVDAFNRDLPYDRFTIEQLAGDLLPEAGDDGRVASAFHRQTRINREAGVDPEEFRIEAVIDRVNTTATVWLGATLGCAQCHDHKYDPFTQRDYYRLLAFFNHCADETSVDAAGVITDVSPKLEWRSAEMQRRGEPAVQMLVMREREQPRATHVFQRGSFLTPGERVEAGTPAVLDCLPAAGGNRVALARWLVDERNPLTARVAVNRLWAQYFGVGLVETLDDFGAQAPPCSHPELLDWLAGELIGGGWHWKRLHRLIVTSATYRQQAAASERAMRVDPENRLLSRAPRLRLPAELVRDSALAAGGLLSLEQGGPSVLPDRSREAGSEASYRRSIYLRWTRQTLDAMLVNFDAPSRDVTCTRRPRTNTPLQALTLLNDRAFLDAARGLARRATSAGSLFDERLDVAFQVALARRPKDDERRVLAELFERRKSAYAADAQAAGALLADNVVPPAELSERAAWVLVCNALLNTNEFITRE